MSSFAMSGLRPEQGPPLSIPLSFFFTGPAALVAAGTLMLLSPSGELSSIWSGRVLGLVHLATLGFLMSVMLGALYQMLPVLAGAVVRAVRLAHLVQLLLGVGAAALVVGLVTGAAVAFGAASAALLLGLLVFFAPSAVALFRSPAKHDSVLGMRVAYLGLFAVCYLGLRLALARAGLGYSGSLFGWRHAHAHLGLLGWIGGLLTAVSWQVVPMFYLSPTAPAWIARAIRWAVLASILGLGAIYAAGLPDGLVPWAALPGAAAVWLVHPLAILWTLRSRRRKRPDPSLRFWQLGLGLGPLVFALGVCSAALPSPHWPLLYGFVALWGWAGSVVLGMLSRIVPFLVWLHRCSRWVGLRPTPSTRELFPDRSVRIALVLHLGSLALGSISIIGGWAWAWRALGVTLIAGAAFFATQLALAIRRAPPREPPTPDPEAPR